MSTSIVYKYSIGAPYIVVFISTKHKEMFCSSHFLKEIMLVD